MGARLPFLCQVRHFWPVDVGTLVLYISSAVGVGWVVLVRCVLKSCQHGAAQRISLCVLYAGWGRALYKGLLDVGAVSGCRDCSLILHALPAV